MSEEKEPKGFKKAREKAEKILSNKEKLKELIQDGEKKSKAKKEKLKSVWSDLQALLRLIKAWKNKEYVKVPWKTILLIAASILYLVNPLDVIPDFIPISGLLDDVTILSFVINSIKDDLSKFKVWEKANDIEPSK